MNILLVSGSRDRFSRLQHMLERPGVRVLQAARRREALMTLVGSPISVIVTDAVLPDGHWSDFLSDLAPALQPPHVIVLSQSSDLPAGEHVWHLEGFDILREPVPPEEVQRAVDVAWRKWEGRRNLTRTAAAAA
jgi:DNA-binding response OmpR family regulator